MMMIEVSGEVSNLPPAVLRVKTYALSRRLFQRELQQLRWQYPSRSGWLCAQRFFRIFWERPGEYHIGLPTMYLPDEVPIQRRYGKYLLSETVFGSYDEALAAIQKNHGQSRKPGHGSQDGGAIRL